MTKTPGYINPVLLQQATDPDFRGPPRRSVSPSPHKSAAGFEQFLQCVESDPSAAALLPQVSAQLAFERSRLGPETVHERRARLGGYIKPPARFRYYVPSPNYPDVSDSPPLPPARVPPSVRIPDGSGGFRPSTDLRRPPWCDCFAPRVPGVKVPAPGSRDWFNRDGSFAGTPAEADVLSARFAASGSRATLLSPDYEWSSDDPPRRVPRKPAGSPRHE